VGCDQVVKELVERRRVCLVLHPYLRRGDDDDDDRRPAAGRRHIWSGASGLTVGPPNTTQVPTNSVIANVPPSHWLSLIRADVKTRTSNMV
jgi:hypothetical protein